jgi:hydroxymethylpyrimidine pyrophosphatase-like HAD family hydrolase
MNHYHEKHFTKPAAPPRVVLRLPRPEVIYVDVDGTLLLANSGINWALVEQLRQKHAAGFSLVLWSARGEQHAKDAANKANCVGLFTAILSKPGFIIDDKGWAWTRYTKRLKAK